LQIEENFTQVDLNRSTRNSGNVIPENFTYSPVPSEDCVGSYYVLRTDTRNKTEERVAYSDITDTDSTYVIKTVSEEDRTNEYWDFGSGWDHFDDFLYNAAFHIFNRFDDERFFEIIVNMGRISDFNDLTVISTKTHEKSISLLVPKDTQRLDVPGLSGEDSTTNDTSPVMFSSIDILNELYWVMREFSTDHNNFRQYLNGDTFNYDLEQSDSFRAYRAIALAYPFFEGLVTQLTDRVKLKNQPFEGEDQIQFRHIKTHTPKDNIKNLIKNVLFDSYSIINEYERDFLVETFYNESIDIGIARNDLAHNIFDATRGFQNIDWRELTRRLIVSIAFLDEKVVCTYCPLEATNIQVFEEWLRQREQAGFKTVQNTN